MLNNYFYADCGVSKNPVAFGEPCGKYAYTCKKKS